MATKTISISDEAYEILKSRKREHESFSKVIVRLSGKKTLASFFGALSEESAKKLAKNVAEVRKRNRKRHTKRLERLYAP